MKNLSRLTALLLALVMLFSFSASATEGVSENSQTVSTEQDSGLVDQNSNPLTYSLWQDMSYQALYYYLLRCETEDELDLYLGRVSDKEFEAFRNSLSQSQRDKLDAHLENIYGGYNGFTLEEVESFTEGFKVNGSYPTGSALKTALFNLSGDAFALAVNQMTIDQAGSLEGIVSDSEASKIGDAMCHSGFDVSGTSADLSGGLYTLRASAQRMAAVASSAPVWPNEGAIKLDKDAVAVEGADNIWEVTLQIQGKNYKTTSDVVLVLDRSGSMSGTKKTNTIKAAKAFGEKLLTENSTTRIAIVTFNKTATAYNSGHFYTSSELTAFNSAIDDAMRNVDGGTNQQAGLHVADQLLSSSSGVQKNIVILSDGAATFSYPFCVGTAGWDGCYTGIVAHFWDDLGSGKIANKVLGTVTPDYSTVVGNGSGFTISGGNAYFNVTCSHSKTRKGYSGTVNSSGVYSESGTSNNGMATIWEANQIKAKGTTIYSVALQAGTNGESVLKSCASDSSKGYFAISSNEKDVEGKLTTAFEAIAGSIAIAASQGVVLDPMGEKVELDFNGSTPVVTNDLSVYNAGNADVYISQGSITYDTETKKFDWTVGNINEGVPAILKYQVRIREGVEVATGEMIPTNKTTTFSYKDYQQNDATGNFPIPEVPIGGGTIMVHWYLVNEDGQPINANGVVVEGKEFAHQLKTAEYHSVDGSIALEYGTPYPITAASFDGYSYYNYTWNTNVGTANTVNVTIPGSASSQHVWFAYTEVSNASLTLSKTVNTVGDTAAPADDTFAFTVELKDESGNALTDSFNYTGSKDGTIRNGGTITLAAGQNVTINELPIGTTYRIVENLTTAQQPYYSAVDAKSGTIAEEGNTVAFVNTYSTGKLTITKTVKDSTFTEGSKTFNFSITGGPVAVENKDIVVGYESKTNSVTISGLPVGSYTVTETAVDGYTATYAVNGVAGNTASVTAGGNAAVSVTNTASGTYSTVNVTKVWNDNNNLSGDRPAEITVNLVGTVDGNETINQASLSAAQQVNGNANQWAYAFPNVAKFDADGNLITYSVTEEAIKDGKYNNPVISGDVNNGFQIVNTLKPGSLEITKTVEDEVTTDGATPDSAQAFTFAVTLKHNGSDLTGVTYSVDGGEAQTFNGTITLTNGQKATFTNLPAGSVYTVTETNIPVGFEVDQAEKTGNVAANAVSTAAFTNTYKVGDLKITKTVTGADAPSAYTFTFTVKSDNIPAGIYGGVEFKAQTDDASTTDVDESKFVAATVTIDTNKGSGTKTITGLPKGATFTVTEAAHADYALTGSTGTTGTIVENAVQQATFTNTYQYASLTIEKEGILPIDHHEKDGTNEKESQSTIFNVKGNGVDMNVVINGNDSVTIKHLPVGSYTVTEDETWSWRYSADKAEQSVTVNPTGENKVTFKNNRDEIYWLSGDCYAENRFGAAD